MDESSRIGKDKGKLNISHSQLKGQPEDIAVAAQRMNDYLNTAVVSPADRENNVKKPASDGRMIRKSQGANTS